MKRDRILSIYFLPASFLFAIAVGTLLLMLPVSTAPGQETDLLTALFTATTSVCVTGLVVVDTYSHWSFFGQLVILILIQIGGLGVVTVGSMIMLLRGQKFYLSDRMLLGDSLNLDRRKGTLDFLMRMLKGVILVEAAGAILCAISFIPVFGITKGSWTAIFQSVSAFCNAGMDVAGPDSMISFRGSYLLMGTTMALIILGGIGFVVWFDFADGVKYGFRRRFLPDRIFSRLPVHTKVVLIATLVLILSGSVCVLAAEFNNPDTLGSMDLPDKLINSLFQSVSFRTAGFASVPQDKLTELSCLIGYILMFIGGSPTGTAGGIKTVTMFFFLMNAFSYINKKKETVVFQRRVPEEQMRKSAAIVFFSLIAVLIMTVLLMALDSIALTDALYETVSALGTVGLSRGLTPDLDSAGRIIIIISMYLGRIGPISMAIIFAKGGIQEDTLTHAEGKFYVG